MDAPLVLEFVGHLAGGPEPQRRHYLMAFRAVEQIERDQAGGNDSGQSDELAQAEVEEVHCGYCSAPDFTSGPNRASSMGIEVLNPTYRPPLRSATSRRCSAYLSNSAV